MGLREDLQELVRTIEHRASVSSSNGAAFSAHMMDAHDIRSLLIRHEIEKARDERPEDS